MKLTQGNLTFMPTQDSVASQQELIVASEFSTCWSVYPDYVHVHSCLLTRLMNTYILMLVKIALFSAVCDNDLLI